jgi:hypothetical protein
VNRYRCFLWYSVGSIKKHFVVSLSLTVESVVESPDRDIVGAQKIVGCEVMLSDRVERSRQSGLVSLDRVERSAEDRVQQRVSCSLSRQSGAHQIVGCNGVPLVREVRSRQSRKSAVFSRCRVESAVFSRGRVKRSR